MWKRLRRVASVLFACSMMNGTAAAAAISYEAINIEDAQAGNDLWTYRYLLTGDPLPADHGFAIYFDTVLFADLSAPSAPAGWDVLLQQPDPGLPSDGIFDALDLIGGAPFGTFEVSFTWLGGGGIPGSQFYEFYALDSEGLYIPLSSGSTVTSTPAPVPESGSLLLLSVGILAGIAARRNDSKQ
jgi:hypothetical protein